MDILDTNIFILAVYSPLHKKAVCKFINENTTPIPFSLYDEILNQTLMLILSFRKILREIEKGVEVNKISEINNLNNGYDNIYIALKQFSNNFQNIEKLKNKLEEGLKVLVHIDSWIQVVRHYPENQQQEKDILKRYSHIKTRLHHEDLKILTILNHEGLSRNIKIRFITRDKNSIYRYKKEIEEKLPYIQIIKISEYINL